MVKKTIRQQADGLKNLRKDRISKKTDKKPANKWVRFITH
jgi:hypothetical protein